MEGAVGKEEEGREAVSQSFYLILFSINPSNQTFSLHPPLGEEVSPWSWDRHWVCSLELWVLVQFSCSVVSDSL